MTDPTAKPRWYCLTPDRAVVAILALEGLLLLSAWFRWFPFNQHKGWSVLVCLAAVGVAFVLIFLWFLAALVFRWRFQFGILSLLLLVVVVAVPFSWLAVEREQVRQQARNQREAVEWIEKAGGIVYYDYQFDPFGNWVPGATPPEPTWLSNLLGDDLRANVAEVILSNCVTDPSHDGLWTLKVFSVSEAGLRHVGRLPQLRRLCLTFTDITDAGLENFERLAELQSLDLSSTKVGDAGLQHLKRLTQLQSLALGGTAVSDAGLQQLQGLAQLQSLDLRGTAVSDAGLDRLKGLTQLRSLDLSGTKVTRAGVKKLQQALPNCCIYVYIYR